MENNIYHITNRGVEKRKIFLNNQDYLRFIHNLQDFNTIESAPSYFNRRKLNNHGDTISVEDKIVDVLCWCLMPNHPHIMAVNKIEKGSSYFSQKLSIGYTMYFNKQNERSGVLFQGRSKIILVQRNAHFLHLPFYIHANPLKLLQPKWKEEGVKNIKKAMEFLEKYRWSSYLDIIGKDNFPDTVNKKMFYEMFNTNEKDYKKEFEDWLRDYGDGISVD